MADRIVVLRAGLVEQAGTPLELYDRPANLFVAGFIGSPAMNLLPARLGHAGGETTAVFDDGQSLAIADRALGQPDQQVSIGLRPEHICVSTNGGIAAEVDLVEQTGADTHLMCRCDDRSLCVVVSERLSPARGDVLHLVPRRQDIHVFDRATGTRVV